MECCFKMIKPIHRFPGRTRCSPKCNKWVRKLPTVSAAFTARASVDNVLEFSTTFSIALENLGSGRCVNLCVQLHICKCNVISTGALNLKQSGTNRITMFQVNRLPLSFPLQQKLAPTACRDHEAVRWIGGVFQHFTFAHEEQNYFRSNWLSKYVWSDQGVPEDLILLHVGPLVV